MRRMLDPTKVGGLPSTIEFDKDENREVKKNLKVDGKLTLQSLVSNTNPDGDITKELGGGGGSTIHAYMIILSGTFYYIAYTSRDFAFTIGQESATIDNFADSADYDELKTAGVHPAAGFIHSAQDSADMIVGQVNIIDKFDIKLKGYDMKKQSYRTISASLYRDVNIVKLY